MEGSMAGGFQVNVLKEGEMGMRTVLRDGGTIKREWAVGDRLASHVAGYQSC